MSESKIHAEVWTGLGVTAWQVRPNFNPSQTTSSVEVNVTETVEKSSLADDHTANSLAQPKWVLIGAGLSNIWQQTDHQAWWLWQSILKFHFGSEEAVVFYDTDALQTEQAMFDVVEHLIELGCEQVYSMDTDHELNEMLAEGLQVIPLPSFEMMLEQPNLKRVFYERLIHLSPN